MTVTTRSIESLRQRFGELFSAAKQKSQLYYYLTIGQSTLSPNALRFVHEINTFTQEAILDRAKPGDAVRPQDILLALQVNLEAKEVYAVLRNVLSILTGRKFHPFPWIQNSECRLRAGRVEFITNAILDSLAADFESIGFFDLAAELRATHGEGVKRIRNAIAHATFLTPASTGDGSWVFSEYRPTNERGVEIVDHRMTKDAFIDLCKRFFNFRLAFMGVVGEEYKAMDNLEAEFICPNQMDPNDMLSCTVIRGAINIKYNGIPLW